MSEVPALPPPDEGRPDLLILAGEHSGDEHAARMAAELLEIHPGLKVVAVGGGELEAAGAQLLFDLTEHSVVGLAEVLRSYGFFKELFEKLLGWIGEHRPRNICLVDYPGFNLRLAKRLAEAGLSRKGGGEMGVFYYIGPQIWAWKAKRRFEMARLLDGLGVIFPFEVDCYEDTNLPVEFVGHPFVAPGCELLIEYDRDGAVLLLPGSRRQPVSRIFPVMADAFGLLAKQRPGERAVVICASESIRELIEAILAARPEIRERVDCAASGEFAQAKALLTSSGTMSLACGLAGIPGAVVYRAHPVTYLWGRMVIQVPYLGIANLLLDEPMYPEYIQGRASPANLAKELEEAIGSKERSLAAQRAAEQLYEKLSPDETATPGAWLSRMMEESSG